MVLVGVIGACATSQKPGGAAASAPLEDLVGPSTRLAVDGDVLAGRVNGGAYAVQIGADGAHGRGPLGPIDLRIRRLARGYALDGTWNGGPVSFVVAGDTLRGSADRPVSDEERRFERCRYDVEKLRGKASYAAREECLEVDSPLRFDLPAQGSTLDDPRTAMMLIAYLVAPPVRDLPGGRP
jgi:hypothetical protein